MKYINIELDSMKFESYVLKYGIFMKYIRN